MVWREQHFFWRRRHRERCLRQKSVARAIYLENRKKILYNPQHIKYEFQNKKGRPDGDG